MHGGTIAGLAACENGFDFRSEADLALRLTVVQGQDAGPISREQQAAAARIPERDRKLSVQGVHEVGARVLVEVHEHFGIGGRSKHVPARAQVVAQLNVVEDLAVEDDLDRSVFVRDGLPAAAEVDDAQPPMREADVVLRIDEEAVAVGAAMREHGGHCAEPLRGDARGIFVECEDAGNSAHWSARTAGGASGGSSKVGRDLAAAA